MKEYIKFEVLEKKPRTNVYGIFSLSDESLLGKIYWYGPWRQYIFDPWKETIWNRGCLKQVLEFIQELMSQRTKKKENQQK